MVLAVRKLTTEETCAYENLRDDFANRRKWKRNCKGNWVRKWGYDTVLTIFKREDSFVWCINENGETTFSDEFLESFDLAIADLGDELIEID